jgi:DNA-binding transcriptional MerR regulator
MRKPNFAFAPQERVFASGDVCRLARISPRQLQWWDERNVASPHHDSRRRAYLAEDVLGIMVIAELRRKGFSLQKIRGLLRMLRRGIGQRLNEILRGESELHVLTDGESVHLEALPERIIDLFKESPQPMFLVSLGDQVRRMAEFREVRGGKKRTPRPENQLTLF